MSAPENRPTPRQLRHLRELAARTASTFAYPATREQASAQIARLRALPRRPHERLAADCEDLVYATAVHRQEVSGFGSCARWRAGGGADV